jgi:hypothetical protein
MKGSQLYIINNQGREYRKVIAGIDFYYGDTVLDCTDSEIVIKQTFRTLQVGKNKHIQNALLDYINHSCVPNTVFDISNARFRAIKKIKKNEEITFFYPGAEIRLSNNFICNCNHQECIKIIRGGFYLVPELINWAIEMGYCTSFFQNTFNNYFRTSAAIEYLC